MSRYCEKGKFIQAWGNVGEEDSYRLIIDCMLNIPLLYWAAEVTGDASYDEMAFHHFNTTADNIIRSNGSTYHTFYFDKETGSAQVRRDAPGLFRRLNLVPRAGLGHLRG